MLLTDWTHFLSKEVGTSNINVTETSVIGQNLGDSYRRQRSNAYHPSNHNSHTPVSPLFNSVSIVALVWGGDYPSALKSFDLAPIKGG
jgi:phospholipase/lecithinase/hemolysin